MSIVRTVWLLGRPGDEALGLLDRALATRGCRTERLDPDRVATWLEQVRGAVRPAALPSLLVVSEDLAWANEGEMLRLLDTQQPWSFLPMVVVARRHDQARCDETYRLGAAGWVVIPANVAEAEEAAQIFAHYWLSTTLLPEIGPSARL